MKKIITTLGITALIAPATFAQSFPGPSNSEAGTGLIVSAPVRLTVTDIQGRNHGGGGGVGFNFSTPTDIGPEGGPLDPRNDGGLAKFRYGHNAIDGDGVRHNGPGGDSTIQWKAPVGPRWQIIISTDNAENLPGLTPDGAAFEGLGLFLPLRFGTPNTGAVGQDPNPIDEDLNGFGPGEIAAADVRFTTYFGIVADADEFRAPIAQSHRLNGDGDEVAGEPGTGSTSFRLFLEVDADTAAPTTYSGGISIEMVSLPDFE